jgi:hypothetical protein
MFPSLMYEGLSCRCLSRTRGISTEYTQTLKARIYLIIVALIIPFVSDLPMPCYSSPVIYVSKNKINIVKPMITLNPSRSSFQPSTYHRAVF